MIKRILTFAIFVWVAAAATLAHAAADNDLFTAQEKAYIQSQKSISIGIAANGCCLPRHITLKHLSCS